MTIAIARQISLPDLLTALDSVRNTERLGSPVNVRLHWQTAGKVERDDVLRVVLSITHYEFPDAAFTWKARSARDVIHLLGSAPTGETALATIALDSEDDFALTVTGNHGVSKIADCWLQISEQDAAIREAVPDSALQPILDQLAAD